MWEGRERIRYGIEGWKDRWLEENENKNWRKRGRMEEIQKESKKF